METIQKAWGEERIIVNNSQYCGKLLLIRKDAQSSLHYHKVKHETFFVYAGKVKLELTGGNVSTFSFLHPGDSWTVPPGRAHRFIGLEDSTIIEFSTHHSDDDVVRLEPSR